MQNSTPSSGALATNWSGHLAYGASSVHIPLSVEEIQEIVRRAPRVKALGSRHSFSAVADTDGEHVCLDGLRRIVGLDREAGTVTVEAGVRYGELAQFLATEGFALHNLASLPHISVAGAVATATHGSGDRLGNLATAVREFDLVRADGEVVRVSRETVGEEFDGMVVHLGTLGIVARLTLAVEPMYEVRQDVFDDLPLQAAVEGYDAITASGQSVSLFTRWNGSTLRQVWVKRRMPAGDLGAEFFGARRADGPRHPLPDMPTVNCTPQMGEPGPWHERLPHFRMEFTPSSGDEIQSEYLIPREYAGAAMVALTEIGERISPAVQISEIRSVAADSLWLSNSYERATVGIHFTWIRDADVVLPLLPLIESALRPFAPRPHWGKVSAASAAELAAAFPRLEDFKALRARLDSEGKFLNPFLRQKLALD